MKSLVIKKPRNSALNRKKLASITMKAIGGDLSRFVGAQSYCVDFDILGTDLRLSSLAKGVRPMLPPKKVIPGDETEIEPNGPSNAQ